VDFDGTCVTHEYPEVGREIEGCVDTLKALIKEGHKLILWTMRDGEQLEDAVKWFKDREISLHGINKNPDWGTGSPKAYASIYIDDAALGCPLVYPPRYKRPYVDWKTAEQLLIDKGIIK
jgi:hypothetical protein